MRRTVRDAMAAVSVELAALTRTASALQAQLSPSGDAAVDIEAFQSLDTLSQTLACLAPFVAKLGADLPAECAVNLDAALGEICLAELSRRLSGVPAAPAPAETSHCELFDLEDGSMNRE